MQHINILDLLEISRVSDNLKLADNRVGGCCGKLASQPISHSVLRGPKKYLIRLLLDM